MALYRTGLYVKNHAVEQVQVAKTPIASYNGNVTGLYIPELIAYIVARQSGSGTPSPDNIRPIIGVSECNVVRCGKNLFPYSTISVYSYSFAVNQNFNQMVNPILLKGGKTYTLSLESGEKIYRLRAFNSSKELITNPTEINMTSGSSGVLSYYSNYKFFGYSGTPNNVNLIQPTNDIWLDIVTQSNASTAQLELGSTATAYEAYNGNTYTIQLDDTYYGGSLDVTNGVLTVDREFEDFDGTENWVNVGGQYPYAFQLDTYIPNIKSSHIPSQNIICNMFKQANVEVPTGDAIRWQVNTKTGRLYVYCHRYSGDLAGFKAMLAENNLQVCYSLATPITVQLSPTQIEQLLGANNVWADTGDVEVKFYNVIR